MFKIKPKKSAPDADSCWSFRCVLCLLSLCYKILPTNRHSRGLPCQKRVWRGSTFPDLNHFCQAKNYQLLGNLNSALMAGRSSLMFPGNKQLIKAAWYLLNPLIHHFMQCPCPPLTSSASVLACPYSPLPVPLVFFIFLCIFLSPIWSPHSHEHISAHPQRVLLSVRALKMSHTALFPALFSLFFLGPPPPLPPLPFPVLSSLLPPPVTRAQGMGGLPGSSLLLPF